MIFLLDPSFIFIPKNSHNQESVYLSSLIEFINKYLDIKFFFTQDYYDKCLSKISQIPTGIGLYEYTSSSYDLFSLLNKPMYIEKLPRIKNTVNIDISFPNDEIKKIYESHISYCIEKNIEGLFFLALCNHNSEINKKIGNILIINHIYKETDSNIAKLISQSNKCFKNLQSPNSTSYLPNKDLCKFYKDEMQAKTKGLAPEEKIPIFIEYFREVVSRNGYLEDNNLEKKNKKTKGKRDKRSAKKPRKKDAIRVIYTANNGTKIHVCADVENGAIEVCNKNGTWKGAYSYEGVCVTSKEKLSDNQVIIDHSIIV